MHTLTPKQNVIHQRAVELSRQHTIVEASLVDTLISVEQTRLYKRLNKSNLFRYVVDILKLSEPVAYGLVAVANRSRQIPALKKAIAEHQLTVSMATRILSALTPENAAELVAFARTHSQRQIDFEVAKRNPRAAPRDKVKPLSEDLVQVTITVSKDTYEKLKRAESLEAQKGKSSTAGAAIGAALDVYLDRHDPVRKAERATKKPGFCAHRNTGRRLTAAQKHAVFARDRGRCTHVDTDGKRCNTDRWVDVHHIILVSEGGTNEPENLTTLCGFHHDQIHQMSFHSFAAHEWSRSN